MEAKMSSPGLTTKAFPILQDQKIILSGLTVNAQVLPWTG
jgi:hypothetical protein